MNKTNGTIDFARLIEEAETQLMGESNRGACTNCGDCNGGTSSPAARCFDNKVKNAGRHPLATASR